MLFRSCPIRRSRRQGRPLARDLFRLGILRSGTDRMLWERLDFSVSYELLRHGYGVRKRSEGDRAVRRITGYGMFHIPSVPVCPDCVGIGKRA